MNHRINLPSISLLGLVMPCMGTRPIIEMNDQPSYMVRLRKPVKDPYTPPVMFKLMIVHIQNIVVFASS